MSSSVPDQASEPHGGQITFRIRDESRVDHHVSVPLSATVADVVSRALALAGLESTSDQNSSAWRLLFRGRVLSDSSVVSTLRIPDGSIIHMCRAQVRVSRSILTNPIPPGNAPASQGLSSAGAPPRRFVAQFRVGGPGRRPALRPSYASARTSFQRHIRTQGFSERAAASAAEIASAIAAAIDAGSNPQPISVVYDLARRARSDTRRAQNVLGVVDTLPEPIEAGGLASSHLRVGAARHDLRNILPALGELLRASGSRILDASESDSLDLEQDIGTESPSRTLLTELGSLSAAMTTTTALFAALIEQSEGARNSSPMEVTSGVASTEERNGSVSLANAEREAVPEPASDQERRDRDPDGRVSNQDVADVQASGAGTLDNESSAQGHEGANTEHRRNDFPLGFDLGQLFDGMRIDPGGVFMFSGPMGAPGDGHAPLHETPSVGDMLRALSQYNAGTVAEGVMGLVQVALDQVPLADVQQTWNGSPALWGRIRQPVLDCARSRYLDGDISEEHIAIVLNEWVDNDAMHFLGVVDSTVRAQSRYRDSRENTLLLSEELCPIVRRRVLELGRLWVDENVTENDFGVRVMALLDETAGELIYELSEKLCNGLEDSMTVLMSIATDMATQRLGPPLAMLAQLWQMPMRRALRTCHDRWRAGLARSNPVNEDAANPIFGETDARGQTSTSEVRSRQRDNTSSGSGGQGPEVTGTGSEGNQVGRENQGDRSNTNFRGGHNSSGGGDDDNERRNTAPRGHELEKLKTDVKEEEFDAIADELLAEMGAAPEEGSAPSHGDTEDDVADELIAELAGAGDGAAIDAKNASVDTDIDAIAAEAAAELLDDSVPGDLATQGRVSGVVKQQPAPCSSGPSDVAAARISCPVPRARQSGLQPGFGGALLGPGAGRGPSTRNAQFSAARAPARNAAPSDELDRVLGRQEAARARSILDSDSARLAAAPRRMHLSRAYRGETEPLPELTAESAARYSADAARSAARDAEMDAAATDELVRHAGTVRMGERMQREMENLIRSRLTGDPDYDPDVHINAARRFGRS